MSGASGADAFEDLDDAATPLTEDEKRGLIPSWVTYRHELNEVEQANIAKGSLWAYRQRKRELLEEEFLLLLHKRLLGEVWRWAGGFRSTERNIGTRPWMIRPELRQLLDDARFWMANGTYGPDELSIRFHHRLVAIHPFPNGNGRHARLMADLLVTRLGGSAFPWGRASLTSRGQVRTRYIDALRAADRHHVTDLITFARS